jgi:hypothetical protein
VRLGKPWQLLQLWKKGHASQKRAAAAQQRADAPQLGTQPATAEGGQSQRLAGTESKKSVQGSKEGHSQNIHIVLRTTNKGVRWGSGPSNEDRSKERRLAMNGRPGAKHPGIDPIDKYQCPTGGALDKKPLAASSPISNRFSLTGRFSGCACTGSRILHQRTHLQTFRHQVQRTPPAHF